MDAIALGPGQRLVLSRPPAERPAGWRVEDGCLDVYVELESATGKLREHLFTMEKGRALVAVPELDGLRLVAAGRGEVVLERCAAAGSTVDAWLEKLLEVLVRAAPRVDSVDELVRPGDRGTLRPDHRASAAEGLVWVRCRGPRLSLLDRFPLEPGGDGLWLPLDRRIWLTAGEELRLEATSSAALGGELPAALERFHVLALDLLRSGLEDEQRRELERLAAKSDLVNVDRRAVLARFSAVIDEQAGRESAEPPLLAACQRIGEELGVEVRGPGPFEWTPRSMAARIEDIGRRSRLRARQVVLRGRWWRHEARPMLAFWRESGQPLVLLPGRGRRTCWEPGSTGEERRVTEEMAREIDPVAWVFYSNLPDAAPTPWSVLAFATSLARPEVAWAAFYGVLGTVMAMLMPVAVAVIIDVSIPGHQRSQLLAVAGGLAVAALAAYAFRVAEGIAVLRIEGKIAEALQPALLDRLLRLPNTFFRRYSAGDLAERVKIVDQMQTRLSGGALTSLLAGLLSCLNFLVLLYWQPAAAAVAALVIGTLALALVLVGRRLIRLWADIHRLEGALASVVLQTVNGIQRIRLAGAEDRIFVRWGNLSMTLRETMTRTFRTENLVKAGLKGFQVLAVAAVFAALAVFDDGRLTTGGFLSFVAAFGLVLTGFTELGRSLLGFFDLVPMYHRLEPILSSVPESEKERAQPGVLSGRLELHELYFRYADGLPWVLEGLSLRVEPGESVAIVGASGSGKSTLFRLVLGFEQATSGSIYFDGKDLAGLDLREVRHQIGVVLQQDALMEGTLFENIRGDNDISAEEAWEAARMCGLGDDIEAMPLGLHTVVSAQGSELSGGQVQRLLIARALAGRPRILLLDEATSALDNRSQAIVTASLDRLRITRVAIAHRLSTVERADRIFAVRAGRVVESGTYGELMALDGFFADLVRRQLH